MKPLTKTAYARTLAICLISALMALSTFAGPAEAMIIPLQQQDAVSGSSAARAADLARIQTALESKVIRQKLMDYGLSPEEAMTKVDGLSSKQIHELAAHTDAVQAGGDPMDAFVGIIVVALLVVVLVLLIQHPVEVK